MLFYLLENRESPALSKNSVTDLLKGTGTTTSKPVATPIKKNQRLGEAVEQRALDKNILKTSSEAHPPSRHATRQSILFHVFK